MDVPVTVNIVWTGPDVMFMPANPVPAVIVNITTYTSTVEVDAAKNGSYTCQATVTSGGTMSGSIDITVGMYLPTYCTPAPSKCSHTAPLPAPTNLRVSSPALPTSITLTWEQPEGANAVDSYEINYNSIIQDCVSEGVGNLPPVKVSVDNSSLRSYMYTLNDGPDSPVEEYSLFRITLTAVNSVTRSVPSQHVMIATAEAGMCWILLVIYY